jgi:L-seryl-tRNA(Ser) seleniumtransferase
VHTSNFRIVGFAETPATDELAKLAGEHGVLLLRDLGSGWPGLAGPVPGDEPSLRGEIAAGADLVAASGDKLLGGPQAGILIGRRDLVRQAARNPLYRALRPGKLTFAALAEVVMAHLRGDAVQELPALRMLAAAPEELEAAARAMADDLRRRVSDAAEITTEAGASEMGGGSMPAKPLATTLVALRPRNAEPHLVEAQLRAGRPPVLVRVHDGRLILDPRTLLPGEAAIVIDRLAGALPARRA